MTYEEFIQNILDTRGRFNCGDEYHETHHIVPKCMGGTNDKENLIDLFAREHFIAHKLLAEENPDNSKLIFAWWSMSMKNNNEYERYELTPEEYEEVRIAMCKVSSESQLGDKNHMYGKHHSEETKRKLSELNKGKNNPFYGKKHSDESKKKISNKRKGQFAGIKNSRIRPVVQCDKNGTFIQCWDYINQASEKLHIEHSHISACCRGKRKSAGGFIWIYEEDWERENKCNIN